MPAAAHLAAVAGPPDPGRPVDLVVAGAGIVGLGVALEAAARGLRVRVVDRDSRPSGASVRNFGHGCLTAQTGAARAYAELARERWLQLGEHAGVRVQQAGTVVVARTAAELAVLAEFTAEQGDQARLLTAAQVLQAVPVAADALVGGALLPRDLRVDPRQAVPALAAHLVSLGIDVRFGVTATGASPGVLHTSQGDVPADHVVLALGHDLDRVLPRVAEAAGVQRCTLHMLRVAAPGPRPIGPAVLSGTSLLRYSGFAACPSAAAVRAELDPTLLAAGVNLMFTQQDDGDLIIGDTHSYSATPSPFAAEALDELVLDQTRRLLGSGPLQVRERWRGTYAWSADAEFVTVAPCAGVRAVAVTSGIGMTTGLGLAPALLDDLLSDRPLHSLAH